MSVNDLAAFHGL